MPSCSHTGTPIHFHSTTTSGSACLMRPRRRLSIAPRQSPSCRMRASISCDGDSPGLALVLSLLLIMSTSASRLDHLPAIAGGIAESCIDRAVSIHRLLRELYPLG